jgi:XTP/dITP diphosphohydrolase
LKLLLATRNQNKLIELRQLLQGTGWEPLALTDFAGVPEVEEDGATFAENACKKARAAVGLANGCWTLAEDAGLEVDALGGEPGILSARYAGEGASDRDRVNKVLVRIVAVPDHKRTARFRCVMCLIDPSGQEELFEGVCEGKIAHHARGNYGFGYDPIFMPEGHGKTFGELGNGTKGRISHRARALKQVVDFLKTRS